MSGWTPAGRGPPPEMVRPPGRLAYSDDGTSAELDDPMRDRGGPTPRRLEVEHPEPQVRGQPDVLRLADVEPLAARVQADLADRRDRGQPLLFPLGVDDVPGDVVHRDGVGGE